MSFIIAKFGLVRDLNPGPLAPKARIIPLDQRATLVNERGTVSIRWEYVFIDSYFFIQLYWILNITQGRFSIEWR